MLSIKLANQTKVPALGLGVWQASPEDCYRAVRHALSIGYRRIDTARAYRNEADVGRAIRDSGLQRSEIFVTTKLWNEHQGYDQALQAFDRSLKDLGLEFIDLYLIHFPVRGKRLESWRALQSLLQGGRVKNIGVSNFMIPHLQELLAHSDSVPVVNQVEFHPFLYQRELLEFCQKQRIQLEAYSPLAQGRKFDHPVLLELSRQHQKSPAQIMIRWALDKNLMVIPKSVTPARISENFAVFDFHLSPADLEKLDQLNCGFRTCWDPTQEP